MHRSQSFCLHCNWRQGITHLMQFGRLHHPNFVWTSYSKYARVLPKHHGLSPSSYPAAHLRGASTFRYSHCWMLTRKVSFVVNVCYLVFVVPPRSLLTSLQPTSDIRGIMASYRDDINNTTSAGSVDCPLPRSLDTTRRDVAVRCVSLVHNG
jgi:hypothetical protein